MTAAGAKATCTTATGAVAGDGAVVWRKILVVGDATTVATIPAFGPVTTTARVITTYGAVIQGERGLVIETTAVTTFPA